MRAHPRHRHAGRHQSYGGVFGGWLMSQMALRGSPLATQGKRGRRGDAEFTGAPKVGDEISVYADLVRQGRSSMTIAVDAEARERDGETEFDVAKGDFTFVALDDRRQAARDCGTGREKWLTLTTSSSSARAPAAMSRRSARPARPQDRDRRAREARRHLPQLGLHPDQGAAALGRDLPLYEACRRLRPDRGEAGFDLAKVVARSRGVAKQLNQGVTQPDEEEQDRGAHGRRRADRRRQADASPKDGKATELAAKHIIVATGARARDLPFAKADGKRIWTYRHAMVPHEMPTELLVIGSGAIGIEFASFYNDMGAEVTVVEMLDRDRAGRGRGRLRRARKVARPSRA